MSIQIYKTNFADEAVGKAALVAAGVWAEVTEEGVTQMVYTNGTQAVVNIGKVIDESKTTDPDNPVYYPGWCYDIMTTDTLDFGRSNKSSTWIFRLADNCRSRTYSTGKRRRVKH